MAGGSLIGPAETASILGSWMVSGTRIIISGCGGAQSEHVPVVLDAVSKADTPLLESDCVLVCQTVMWEDRPDGPRVYVLLLRTYSSDRRGSLSGSRAKTYKITNPAGSWEVFD